VEDKVQQYPIGGLVNVVTVNCGGTEMEATSGDLFATTIVTEIFNYRQCNCYKYSATATNCRLSLVGRTATGMVGNITVTGQQNMDTLQTITIRPVDYDFVPTADGYYTVTIPCTNVVISDPLLSITSPVTHYVHPNIVADEIKNVRIVDFNKRTSAGKPQSYGSVVFGRNTGGSLYSTHTDETFAHLNYWTTSNNYNYLYRTNSVAENNVGDYFIHVMDCGGNSPSIEWFFPHETPSGSSKTGYGDGRYGLYEGKYAFSGLHRVFIPWGEQEIYDNCGVRFNIISTGVDQKLAFFLGGFTCPINNVLMLNGYQTGAETNEIAPSMSAENLPDAAVAKVTVDACAKLAEVAGEDTMVYVIKYGADVDVLDSCGAAGKIKVYPVVNSEEDLNKTLHEIAADIKSFAGYSAPQTEEIDL
jgi:hypothetical protein